MEGTSLGFGHRHPISVRISPTASTTISIVSHGLFIDLPLVLDQQSEGIFAYQETYNPVTRR